MVPAPDWVGTPRTRRVGRLGIGQCAQEDGVDDAEDGGVRADTKSQSEDGDRSKATAFEQHTEAELDVLTEIHHGTILFPGLDEGKAQKSCSPVRKGLHS